VEKGVVSADGKHRLISGTVAEKVIMPEIN
jgi:hypothetical protein